MKSNNVKKYGVEFPLQSKIIRDKGIKTKIDKYGNDPRVAISKQQKYICDIYKGKLNVFVNGYFADMIIDNNIICEYDGSGHNLSVKMGKLTQQEFDEKEYKRTSILLSKGFKIFRLISKHDILPSEQELILIKDNALYILNTLNKSVYVYDLETKSEKSI